MASKIDIISNALKLLGAQGTDTIGEDATDIVKAIRDFYDPEYRSILGSRYWSFALKGAVLSKLAGQLKVTGWEYTYAIPEDYLLISHMQPKSRYEIIGNVIYTNTNNTDSNNLPTLFYTHTVSEEVLPPHFSSYLERHFAAIFAMPVTQDVNVATLWANQAKLMRNDSVVADSQSQTSKRFENNYAEAAFYGAG